MRRICYTDRRLGRFTGCGELAATRAADLVCETGRPDRPVTCPGCTRHLEETGHATQSATSWGPTRLRLVS